MLVLSIALTQGVWIPAVALQESYKSFVEAVERNHGKHQTVYVFPRNLDYTTLIFYGGERFQLLAWDTDVLLEKLKRTDDYVIVGEKESKTVTAYSSLLLPHCCEGRGPFRTATIRYFWFVAPRVKAMIA